MNRENQNWLGIGILCGVVPMFVLLLLVMWYSDYTTDRLFAVQRETAAMNEVCLEDLQKVTEDLQKVTQIGEKYLKEHIELYSMGTLLAASEQPTQAPGLTLFDGMLTVGPGPRWGNGSSQPLAPRSQWIIPLKVTPTLFGDLRGAVYYHVDAKTGKIAGPFQPTREKRLQKQN